MLPTKVGSSGKNGGSTLSQPLKAPCSQGTLHSKMSLLSALPLRTLSPLIRPPWLSYRSQPYPLNQFHHLSISSLCLCCFFLPLVISQLHLPDFSACCDAAASTCTHRPPSMLCCTSLSTYHMPSSAVIHPLIQSLSRSYCVPGLH